MFVGTVDGSATNWGKLFVEYDVEFFVPQIIPTGLPFGVTTINSAGGSVSNTNIFGAAPVYNNLGALQATAATMTLTFPLEGYYWVQVAATGSGSPVLSYTTSTATIGADVGAGSSSVFYGMYAVNATANNQTLVLTCTNTVSSSCTIITPVSLNQYDVLLSDF